MNTAPLESVDLLIAQIIARERERQETTLELIASENAASPAVMAVQGSVLTNKYAEGYPAKRYYGGCEMVDKAEQLAVERAEKLFCAEHANVQPHSGSQANMVVLFSLLDPGDTVLGMDLAHGGHLTHGHPASFSGKLYRFVHYGVGRETGTIDYDQVAELAQRHRPKMMIAGASAYPRVIDFDAFSRIARSVGAALVVDMAHIAGLVAADLHPSPVPHADVVTSTTHKTLRGPRGGLILCRADRAKAINSELFPGVQGGPLMHVIAAKAVAFQEAASQDFRDYQLEVVRNARAMAAKLQENGIPLVSGGTDNHMMLADLTQLDITGKQAQEALGQAGITVNKNAVPFDRRSPAVTSGIRIGTPAVTTRGLGETEIQQIAGWIAQVLRAPDDETQIQQIRRQVLDLCAAFPLYPQ